MTATLSAEKRERLAGLLFTGGAFLFWGLYPPYWKLLSGVPHFQVFAHRVVWSCTFTACVITIQGRWAEVRAALGSRKTALTLLASGLCVATNWSIYIFGVLSGRLVSVSMGYFINPLVSVLLGVLVLRERLRFWQIVAVLCAFSGVLYMALGSRGLPWISLSLAFSFGLYGLLRKTVAVESIPGTFVESLLVSPIVISFLLYEAVQGRSAFGTADASTHLLQHHNDPVSIVEQIAVQLRGHTEGNLVLGGDLPKALVQAPVILRRGLPQRLCQHLDPIGHVGNHGQEEQAAGDASGFEISQGLETFPGGGHTGLEDPADLFVRRRDAEAHQRPLLPVDLLQ